MNPLSRNAARKAVIMIIVMAFILFIEHIGLFNGINNYFYDLFFRMRGPGESSKNIIIVAVDDKTLGKLGRWPLRRLYYASLLKWLKEADVVAFDIIMAEPSEDDAALGKAITRHGKVVLPVAIDDRMGISCPVATLRPARLGHIHLEPGIDGVVREIYHTLLYQNYSLPSFSSVIFEMGSRTKFRRMGDASFPGKQGGIVQLDRMNINYCGAPGTFERISLSDILEGLYPPSFFKNRICLIGITATGLSETMLIPFSQERKGMPGIEVHANSLNTLLFDNAIRVVPYWIRWLSAIFLALPSFLCFLRINELKSTVLLLFMIAGIALVTYVLFSRFAIWLAPSIFYFTVLSIFAMTYAIKFNEAVTELDRSYMSVTPHLRRQARPSHKKRDDSGLRGLLTPGGVYSKAQVLADMTNQLIFEKELTDSAIYSDLQGVLLFGPDKTIVLANNLAGVFCKENSITVSSIDAFIKGLTAFIMEKGDLDDPVEKLYTGKNPLTFNVFFPSPEKRFFKVDGSSLTIENKRYPLFVFSDISKIKELEILKSQIVSFVSHEIKTPMMSIQGFGEILFDRLEGEMKEFAGIVRKESERLLRFLNTFLDITRIEENRQPVNLTSVILSDVVKEVAFELKPIAESVGITINSEIPAEIGPAVVDRDLTKQCLINLLENAIKYSSPGKEVIIRLTEEPEHLKAEIIDQGIGIREEDVVRVFDKFYRAQPDGLGNREGSGLGLTFVKEAIELQGGKVLVESRYGGGSTFTLMIPKGDAKNNQPLGA